MPKAQPDYSQDMAMLKYLREPRTLSEARAAFPEINKDTILTMLKRFVRVGKAWAKDHPTLRARNGYKYKIYTAYAVEIVPEVKAKPVPMYRMHWGGLPSRRSMILARGGGIS